VKCAIADKSNIGLDINSGQYKSYNIGVYIASILVVTGSSTSGADNTTIVIK